MNFPRFQILQNWLRPDRRHAEMLNRWAGAYQRDPKMFEDLLELGGVLQIPHEIPPDPMTPAPVDPHRLAFEAGQRDLAVKLAAMMGVTNYELSKLMEADHVQN